MIPSRLLVLLSLFPLGLSLFTQAWPEWIGLLLAVDLVWIGVALWDLRRATGAFEVQREVAPIQAVGRPFEVLVRLIHGGDRALQLRMTDDAPGQITGLPQALRLGPGERAELRYTLQVDRRGQHPFGPVTLRWRSPLGLWERQRRYAVQTILRVHPTFRQLRSYGLDTSLAAQRIAVRARRRPGGENEFERLRPYVSGDPYRHIDWRATARRREFVTREFGQESNQNVIFLLDMGRMMSARSGQLTGFDHALDAAMVMGQVALRHGDRVGLLAFDSQIRAWLPPKGGARSGSRLIRGTYDLFPTLQEPNYALAYRHLAQRVRRRSLVILLTAIADEVSAERANEVVAALTGRHLAVSVWLRDTDLDARIEAPAQSVADVWRRAAAAELAGARERSLVAIRRRGALVVDCAPERLTTDLLGRYLEIKSRRML